MLKRIVIAGVCIVILAVYFFTASRKRSKTLKQKATIRGQISRTDFIGYFEEKGFDQVVIEKVHERLSNYVPKKDFSIHPNDSPTRDFHIDGEDLLDLCNELFKDRHGRKPKKEDYQIAEEQGAEIHTIEGILIFAHSGDIQN